MSTPAVPTPAMPVMSIMASTEHWAAEGDALEAALKERHGPLEYDTGLMLFDHTHYYDEELGSPIRRKLLAFKNFVPHDTLADMKLDALEREKKLARPDGSRTFNLDPGLLTLERLVLATGKNFTHRVYLREGIWADLTLIYQKGDWRSLPWTFADYASEGMLKHLRTLRSVYKQHTQG